MPETAQNLSELITKLIEEKTFSLDALGAIKQIRDNCKVLEEVNKAQVILIEEKDKTINLLDKENQTLRLNNDLWRSRELQLNEKESSLIEKDQTQKTEMAEFKYTREQKSNADILLLVGTIFKNNKVTEMISRWETENGYNGQGSTNSSKSGGETREKIVTEE